MWLECLLFLPFLLLAYHWWATNYWKRRGVLSVPAEFIFGNTREIVFLKTAAHDFFDRIYKKYKENKLIGFYNFYQPMLLVTDLDLMKQIYVSDFNSFSSQILYINKKNDPIFTLNPFMSTGEEWKTRRALQTTMQTQSKLKDSLPLMQKNIEVMVSYIKEKNNAPLLIEEITKFYTINNAISIFLGLEPDAFRNPQNSFRNHAYNILPQSMNIFTVATIFIPILSDILALRVISKELTAFFTTMASQIVENRKGNSNTRNDLIDQLLKLDQKLRSEGKSGLSAQDYAGHISTSYVDSVESSSGILCFLLLELANRQDFQERLREEILTVGNRMEDFDYEKVHKISYLTMIINETLRLHPIAFFFGRLCTKTTNLGDVEIQQGTKVFIPYNSMVNDPEYFPDPERFDPDRFADENKMTFIKNSFFPFGEGPRQCLGMRYALLQLKMAVVGLVLNFRLMPTKLADEKKVSNDKSNSLLQVPEKNSTIIFQPLNK